MYDLDLNFLSFSKTQKNSISSGKKRTLRIIFFNFFLMRTVRSPWSTICKKRFRNPTYIDLTRVSRVNTNWGKSPALYNGVHVLVLFNHLCVFDSVCVSNFLYNDNEWPRSGIELSGQLKKTIVPISHVYSELIIFFQWKKWKKNHQPALTKQER